MRITDVIAGLSALLWVAVVGSIVMVTFQASRGMKVKNGRGIIIAILAAALIVMFHSRLRHVHAFSLTAFENESASAGKLLRWIMNR